METRFQYFLLKLLKRLTAVFPSVLCVGLSVCIAGGASVKVYASDKSKIDSEYFELGINTGFLTIKDFTSEFTYGINATFRTTENFFFQSNYFLADVGLSSVEGSSQGPYTGNREYRHFNLLLGYTIFQGEVFRGSYAGLSSFYVDIGVGDTKFLDESSFTYVYGIGYQMALSRRYALRFDYRNYLYDSIIVDQAETSVKNSHLDVSISWLF